MASTFKEADNSVFFFVFIFGYASISIVERAIRADDDLKVIDLELTGLDNSIENLRDNFLHSLSRDFKELHDQLVEIDFVAEKDTYKEIKKVINGYFNDSDPIYILIQDLDTIENDRILKVLFSFINLNLDKFKVIICNKSKGDNYAKYIKSSANIFYINSKDFNHSPRMIEDAFHHFDVTLTHEEALGIYKVTNGWPLATFLYIDEFKKTKAYDALSVPLNTRFCNLIETYHATYEDREIKKIFSVLGAVSYFTYDLIKDVFPERYEEVFASLNKDIFLVENTDEDRLEFSILYKTYLTSQAYLFTDKEMNTIFAKMAVWYDQHSDYQTALRLFIRLQDYENILKAISNLGLMNLDEDLYEEIEEIVSKFPKEYVESEPILSYYKAFAVLKSYDFAYSEDLLEDLIERLKSSSKAEDHDLLGETYILLGYIYALKGNIEYLEFLRKAYEMLPEGSKYFNGKNYEFIATYPYFLLDRSSDSIDRMVTTYKSSLKYLNRLLHSRGKGSDYLLLAEIALYRYEIAESKILAYQALYQSKRYGQHDIVAATYLILTRLALLTGDVDELNDVMRESNIYVNQNPGKSPQYMSEMTYAFVELKIGDHKKVNTWMEKMKDLIIDSKLMQILPYTAYAESLYMNGKISEALAVLEDVNGSTIKHGMWFELLNASVMKSILYLELGDETNAIKHFRIAYNMAYESDIVTPFILAGNHFDPVLKLVNKYHQTEYDIEWLYRIRSKALDYGETMESMKKGYNKKQPVLKKYENNNSLTPSETEILFYLSRGLTLPAIAEERSVSVNTVKTQVANIYDKLEANNRADAIRIATSLEIID